MKFRFSEKFVIDSDVEPWKSEGIRFAFFSAPGTRKSYTVAACIVEPFLDEGGTVVIFEPRSEWHTLKQRYESVLVVGGPFQDIPLSVNHARVYAEAIVKHGASMVFDFSELEDKDLVRFAAELLARLFTLQNVVRRPLLLFIEEGVDYCPFSTKGKTVEPWVYARMVDRVVKIATQGRPLGFTMAITSQRPAQLNYTVRMMCNVSFYGKFHPKDLNDIKQVLQPYDVPGTETAEKCVNMPHGSWIVITAGGASLHSLTVERRTPHGADTPKLDYEATRTEETKQTIDELSGTIIDAMKKEEAEKSDLEKAKRKIRDLEKKLATAEEKARIKLSVKEMLKAGPEPAELAEKLAKAKTEIKQFKDKVAGLENHNKLLEVKAEDLTKHLKAAEANLKLYDELRSVFRRMFPRGVSMGPFAPPDSMPSEAVVGLESTKTIYDMPDTFKPVKISDETIRGKVLRLARTGFLDKWCRLGEIHKALIEQFGWTLPKSSLQVELNRMVNDFLLGSKKDSHKQQKVYKLAANVAFKQKEVEA